MMLYQTASSPASEALKTSLTGSLMPISSKLPTQAVMPVKFTKVSTTPTLPYKTELTATSKVFSGNTQEPLL